MGLLVKASDLIVLTRDYTKLRAAIKVTTRFYPYVVELREGCQKVPSDTVDQVECQGLVLQGGSLLPGE
jgi:hypothetical protein